MIIKKDIFLHADKAFMNGTQIMLIIYSTFCTLL